MNNKIPDEIASKRDEAMLAYLDNCTAGMHSAQSFYKEGFDACFQLMQEREKFWHTRFENDAIAEKELSRRLDIAIEALEKAKFNLEYLESAHLAAYDVNEALAKLRGEK